MLDRLLDREVRARFHGKSISVQVPEFADGKLIPTCENLARFIFERLAGSLPGPATLTSVVVREDETISAEFTGERLTPRGVRSLGVARDTGIFRE